MRGGWGWVELYFGWVQVGAHFLLVSGGKWRWVEVYFVCVDLDGGDCEWVGVVTCFNITQSKTSIWKLSLIKFLEPQKRLFCYLGESTFCAHFYARGSLNVSWTTTLTHWIYHLYIKKWKLYVSFDALSNFRISTN